MGLHPIFHYDDDDSDPFWVYICSKGADQGVPGWSHKRMMDLNIALKRQLGVLPNLYNAVF